MAVPFPMDEVAYRDRDGSEKQVDATRLCQVDQDIVADAYEQLENYRYNRDMRDTLQTEIAMLERN